LKRPPLFDKEAAVEGKEEVAAGRRRWICCDLGATTDWGVDCLEAGGSGGSGGGEAAVDEPNWKPPPLPLTGSGGAAVDEPNWKPLPPPLPPTETEVFGKLAACWGGIHQSS
jgi:hypothetical protein